MNKWIPMIEGKVPSNVYNAVENFYLNEIEKIESSP